MLTPYPLEPPPPLPPLDDPWEAPAFALQSGRRGGWDGDRVWFAEGPDLEGLAVLGPLELRDRRVVALEEPLFVWEVAAQGDLQLTCSVAFEADRVHYERAADGSRLWLGGELPPDELLVSCYGGVLEVTEEGGKIRLRARGRDRVRLVMVAAWDEADRDRTLRALQRKGVGGVVAQYVRHAEMIEALGAKLTTPDPEVNRRFAHDKLDLDCTLSERRAGHRSLLEPLYYGLPLLTLGLREAVRDTLRGPLDEPEVRRLFAAYVAWAGADEFVRRHWRRLEEAMRNADVTHAPFGDPDEAPFESGRADHEDAAAELIAVAEALGDHAAVAMFEGVIAGVDDLPRARPWHDFDTPLDRWQITPCGLDGTVTLAPELPHEWPEMTVEGLRIGATSLDVRVRRRPGGIAVKCRVTRGPPIVVQLAPRLAFRPTGILLDGEPFSGPAVRFTVQEEGEAVWIE